MFDILEGDHIPSCPLEERANQSIAQGSSVLLNAIQHSRGLAWECGCHKTDTNTHTIAGKQQCATCRRRRWNAGFRRVVSRKIVARESTKLAVFEHQRIRRERNEAIIHPANGRMTLEDLKIHVSEAFNISIAKMCGPSRIRNAVNARAVIIRILRDRGLSYPVIARCVGKSDHSTIIHALANFDVYVQRDPKVFVIYQELRDREPTAELEVDHV